MTALSAASPSSQTSAAPQSHLSPGAPSPARRLRPRQVRRWGRNLCAIAFCLVWFFPVYWMVLTSIKPRNQVMSATPEFLPRTISFENYDVAINTAGFFTNLYNSVIVTVSAIVVSVLIAFLASAALTQYSFRGRKVIMVVILAVQMIPATAMLIPQFVVFNQAGMLNTYFGLILAYIAMALPFSIWNMRGFFLAIPKDIFESARVEGASEWQILRRITFPMVAPGVVSTSVFAFINAWNDYLISYTFMQDQSKYTLPVWLSSFATPNGTDFGGQMAASVLFSLPVVIFFIIVQHNIAKGITAGAVK